jgi:hypothetical protein
VVVRARNGLPGLLRRGVERGRAVRAVVLGEGRGGVEPVHGRGGGPHDGWLRVGVPRRGLEERDEAGHVGGHVGLRRAHRVAHAGLRRQVEHVRERDGGEEPLQQRGVEDGHPA